MRKTHLLVFIALSAVLRAVPPPPGISVTEQFSSTNLWPHEMLYVYTVISNALDHPVSVKGIATTAWQIRRQGEMWQTCSWYGPMPLMLPREIVLPAGGSLDDYRLICTDSEGRGYFAEPGRYEIQSGSVFGESEIGFVDVLPLAEHDDILANMPPTTALLFEEMSFNALCREMEAHKHKSLEIDKIQFLSFLEGSDKYADWVAMMRLWDAKRQRKLDPNASDSVPAICRSVIQRHGETPVSDIHNPIPLLWSYMQLAKWLWGKGQREEARATLADARRRFADTPPLLRPLEWECADMFTPTAMPTLNHGGDN